MDEGHDTYIRRYVHMIWYDPASHPSFVQLKDFDQLQYHIDTIDLTCINQDLSEQSSN